MRFPTLLSSRAHTFAAAVTLLTVANTASVAVAENRFGWQNDVIRDARSNTRAAYEELAQARLALYRARLSTIRASHAAHAELRDAVGLRDLQREAALACSLYNELRRPVLLILRQDEEYTTLYQERETARQAIARLADQDKATYLELLPHAKAAMDAGRRMTRAEVIAIALDPAIEDARLAMVEAYTRLRIARQTAQQAIAEHPGMLMANDEMLATRRRIDLANKQLAIALRTEAAFDRR